MHKQLSQLFQMRRVSKPLPQTKSAERPGFAPRDLDAKELRQVVGGSPTKNW